MATITDSDILDEIVTSAGEELPAEAARAFLDLRFRQSAIDRMNDLAERNQNGSLSADEQSELDAYRRAGSLMNLLQAKARISLRDAMR
jgi:hypothetical protein